MTGCNVSVHVYPSYSYRPWLQSDLYLHSAFVEVRKTHIMLCVAKHTKNDILGGPACCAVMKTAADVYCSQLFRLLMSNFVQASCALCFSLGNQLPFNLPLSSVPVSLFSIEQ